MKKIKYLVPVLLLVFSLGIANAQDYKTALGLRLGTFTGVTVKHTLKRGAALEGLLTTRWNGLIITGLYEFTGNAFDEPGMNWYLGGGAHLGFWGDRYWHKDRYYDNNTVFGVDFIAGLEYTFQEIPLNLALDWKPSVNFVGYNGWWSDGIAVSVRFVIR